MRISRVLGETLTGRGKFAGVENIWCLVSEKRSGFARYPTLCDEAAKDGPPGVVAGQAAGTSRFPAGMEERKAGAKAKTAVLLGLEDAELVVGGVVEEA
jgi:hypothetical protein